MVQDTVQQQANTTFEKAAQVGVPLSDKKCSPDHPEFLRVLEYCKSSYLSEMRKLNITKVLYRQHYDMC